MSNTISGSNAISNLSGSDTNFDTVLANLKISRRFYKLKKFTGLVYKKDKLPGRFLHHEDKLLYDIQD